MCKKKESIVFPILAITVFLTVIAGVIFLNNVTAVINWWIAFSAAGGDTALVPARCSGFWKALDWSVVDYSCASTLIPFLGFTCMSIGLIRILAHRKIDSEFFPFFRSYDQLNIAFGLIGTLWGIIVIGYYKMDTVEMSNLMTCLHTALFSTLIAVVWVFVVDHSMLRPLMRMLLDLSGFSRPEDADLADVFERIKRGAYGLEETWISEQANLRSFTESVNAARGEIERFAETGDVAREMLTNGLSSAVSEFISRLEAASEDVESRRIRHEAAFNEEMSAAEARRVALDTAAEKRVADAETILAEVVTSLAGITATIRDIQSSQRDVTAMAERLAGRNEELIEEVARVHAVENGLRGSISELDGTLQARTKELSAAVAELRRTEEENSGRVAKLHNEIDAVELERARLDAEKTAALRESAENESRAVKAEGMLEKVRSAFSQQA